MSYFHTNTRCVDTVTCRPRIVCACYIVRYTVYRVEIRSYVINQQVLISSAYRPHACRMLYLFAKSCLFDSWVIFKLALCQGQVVSARKCTILYMHRICHKWVLEGMNVWVGGLAFPCEKPCQYLWTRHGCSREVMWTCGLFTQYAFQITLSDDSPYLCKYTTINICPHNRF